MTLVYMEQLYSKLSIENIYKDSYPLGKEKQEDIKKNVMTE